MRNILGQFFGPLFYRGFYVPNSKIKLTPGFVSLNESNYRGILHRTLYKGLALFFFLATNCKTIVLDHISDRAFFQTTTDIHALINRTNWSFVRKIPSAQPTHKISVSVHVSFFTQGMDA